MPDSTVGYVLVSPQVNRRWVPCADAPRFSTFCGGCTPTCVPSRSTILADRHAHEIEIPTGGTRLGPLHYFQDCSSLTGKRGGNYGRPDARVIGLPIEFLELLALPVCKTCEKRLAAMEASCELEPQSVRPPESARQALAASQPKEVSRA